MFERFERCEVKKSVCGCLESWRRDPLVTLKGRLEMIRYIYM